MEIITNECPVCMEEMVLMHIPGCKHAFCPACIEQHIKTCIKSGYETSCLICEQSITEEMVCYLVDGDHLQLYRKRKQMVKDIKGNKGQIAPAGTISCSECSVPIYRTGGCNELTCTICKTKTCWLCRRKIGEGHFISPINGCTFYGKKKQSYIRTVFCCMLTPLKCVGVSVILLLTCCMCCGRCGKEEYNSLE